MRIPIAIGPLLVGAAVLTMSGCASAGAGTAARTPSYSIGAAPLQQAQTRLPFILNRHGYEMFREYADESSLRYITNWRSGVMTVDPETGRMAEGQVRLIVQGFPRRGAGGPIMYRMEVQVESEFRESRDQQWAPGRLSPHAQEELNRLLADLRGEFGFQRRY